MRPPARREAARCWEARSLMGHAARKLTRQLQQDSRQRQGRGNLPAIERHEQKKGAEAPGVAITIEPSAGKAVPGSQRGKRERGKADRTFSGRQRKCDSD